MAKKKPAVVEKRSKGPYMAVAAGVCFALALLCLLVFIFAGSVPQLSGLSGALRGLGGDLRFVLPLAFVWFGVSFAGAARGKRLGVLRALADVLIVLLFYAALHMFWADYVNENGYHVQAALGYGDFLKKSYDFGVGGGALGALLGGFAYMHLGKWLGFFALLLLLLGCLALNGYLGRWVRFVRVRLEDGRIARQEEERRRREEDADRNFELDRRTMLRAEEMIPQTPRRARPHAPETPVEARRRAADEPASPMDAPRRRPRAAAEAPAEAAPRRRARTDAPVSPMEARSRRQTAGADAAAEEAPAPRPKKRVKTAPRIYNETVEDGPPPRARTPSAPWCA